jgi:hypothetical protein
MKINSKSNIRQSLTSPRGGTYVSTNELHTRKMLKLNPIFDIYMEMVRLDNLNSTFPQVSPGEIDWVKFDGNTVDWTGVKLTDLQYESIDPEPTDWFEYQLLLTGKKEGNTWTFITVDDEPAKIELYEINNIKIKHQMGQTVFLDSFGGNKAWMMSFYLTSIQKTIGSLDRWMNGSL